MLTSLSVAVTDSVMSDSPRDRGCRLAIGRPDYGGWQSGLPNTGDGETSGQVGFWTGIEVNTDLSPEYGDCDTRIEFIDMAVKISRFEASVATGLRDIRIASGPGK
jgi:hypothetical protein